MYYKYNADTSFHTQIRFYMIIMQLKDNSQNRNEYIKNPNTIQHSKMNRKSNESDRHNVLHIECIMHVNDDDVVAAVVRKSIWEIMETMFKNPNNNNINPSEVIINGITRAAKPIYRRRRPNSISYILQSRKDYNRIESLVK